MSAEGRQTPIRQSVDQVYERVRDAILEGTLADDVAGRPRLRAGGPLREALRMLQGEGLIDAQAPLAYAADNGEPADLG